VFHYLGVLGLGQSPNPLPVLGPFPSGPVPSPLGMIFLLIYPVQMPLEIFTQLLLGFLLLFIDIEATFRAKVDSTLI